MRDTIQEIVRIEATVGRTGSGSSSACLRVDLACILGFPKGSACHRACSASQHLLSCSRIKGSARGVIEPPAATKTTPHRKWRPWDTRFACSGRHPRRRGATRLTADGDVRTPVFARWYRIGTLPNGKRNWEDCLPPALPRWIGMVSVTALFMHARDQLSQPGGVVLVIVGGGHHHR